MADQHRAASRSPSRGIVLFADWRSCLTPSANAPSANASSANSTPPNDPQDIARQRAHLREGMASAYRRFMQSLPEYGYPKPMGWRASDCVFVDGEFVACYGPICWQRPFSAPIETLDDGHAQSATSQG